MGQRLWYILKTYLLTVAIFVIAKPFFMLCNSAAHPFTIGDVFAVVLHGLSLDLSTALYFLILPFLLLMVSIFWVNQKALHLILNIYWAIIACAFSLAFVADTSLYEFWQFKLDASCLQYLETPTEAMASVSTGYLILRVMVFLLLTAAIFLPYGLAVRSLRTLSPFHTDKQSALVGLLVDILLIPVIVIGIRGGLGESTTNIGQVYFSQNQFLNHAAVNPLFSFLSSFEKTASYIPDYQFADDEACEQAIQALYPTESIDSDTLLNTTRPNVVIILLESCGEVIAHAMPHLQQLKQEGVTFSRCYANSWRTDRGTVCTWSGFPSFPTSSVMKMPSKSQRLPSIARTLRQEGYHTFYLYGGDINFTNMRSYLVGTGFERLHWKTDYTQEEQQSAQWGVRDDITFNTLYDLITHEPAPFLIGYSTLSTHEPWDVPIKVLDNEIENAFCYLDQCIYDLVERLKKTPQWNNLLLVLLPDHSMDYMDIGEYNIRRNHIPLLWLGGAVRQPRQIDVICNQTDLPATLLGQMHLPHQAFRYSRDVVSKNYTSPFATHTFNNGISMVDSTGLAVYDLNVNKIAVEQSPAAQQMIHVGQMVLQAAAKDINKQR